MSRIRLQFAWKNTDEFCRPAAFRYSNFLRRPLDFRNCANVEKVNQRRLLSEVLTVEAF